MFVLESVLLDSFPEIFLRKAERIIALMSACTLFFTFALVCRRTEDDRFARSLIAPDVFPNRRFKTFLVQLSQWIPTR